MLPAFNGRITRRTYIIGNLIAVGVLAAFCAIIVIFLAIVDLVVNNPASDNVLKVLYYAVVFPALLYYFYFAVLMVKRAHDIGWPGLLLFFGFTLAIVLSRVLDQNMLTVAAILVVAFLCLKPGTKSRNNFGPPPRKNFKLDNLKITF